MHEHALYCTRLGVTHYAGIEIGIGTGTAQNLRASCERCPFEHTHCLIEQPLSGMRYSGVRLVLGNQPAFS